MSEKAMIERFPVKDAGGAEKAIHDINHIETNIYFYKGPAGGQSTYRLSVRPIEIRDGFVTCVLGIGRMSIVEMTKRFNAKRASELAKIYCPGHPDYDELLGSVMKNLNLVRVSKEVANASEA